MNILVILAGHFLLLSITAIGGVNASMPEIHRVFVESLHLLSNQEFSELYALSQAAPGPNLLFVALFGWKIASYSGATISLLAMCIPSSLFAIFTEHFGTKYQKAKWSIVARSALSPVTIGLMCSSGLILLKESHHTASIVLTLATIATMWKFKKLNPIWAIIAGAVLGITGIV